MAFKSKTIINSKATGIPSFKVYLHESVSRNVDAYGKGDPEPTIGRLHENAVDYLVEGLRNEWERLVGAQFGLASLWAQGSMRVADIFLYSDIRDWPGNPDVEPYVMRDGVWSKGKVMTCGETLVALGMEEAYRQTTKSLEGFMAGSPELTPGAIPIIGKLSKRRMTIE